VEVVKVQGVIDAPMRDYIVGSLADAERSGSTVVIQLDTRGTLGVSAPALARRVFEATIPVIVWIGPAGSHAQGGALLLVYAASVAFTSPGSGVGPLEPLDLARKASAEGAGVRPEALAQVRRYALARGRDPAFASQDHEAPAREAIDRGVVEGFASDLTQLLRKADGSVVEVAGRRVPLRTDPDAVPLRFHDLGPGRRVLHAIASPVAIYVLLVLGLWGIAFELTQSGIGMAGIAGAGAVALGIYGLVVVPFDPLGLALLLGGLALLSLDVELRRLGPITAAGMVAFVAGSLIVFHRVSAAIDLSPWLVWPVAVVTFLYYGFALTVAQKSRERILSTQRGLIGLVGEARGRLDPEGPVHVKGALWRGRTSNGAIPAGTRVRVRGVDGLTLRVEPEEG
jgi:membrane-bound serine protease (ClpP class)